MSNTILNAGPSPRHGGGFIGGGSGSDDTTWFVYVRNTASSGPPEWKRGVAITSPLQQLDDPRNLTFPTGRLDNANPSLALTGFVATGDGDFVWAEIEFDYTNPDNPLTIGSFGIKSIRNGDSFKGKGIYINLAGDDSSPQNVQWKLCIPVVTINNNPDIEEPTPRVDQRYLKTPIRLVARTFTMYDSDGEEPTDVGGLDYEA